MLRARIRNATAIAAALLVMFGCGGQGYRPFLIAEICVHDRVGVDQLIGDLKQLAASEHMEFIDGSAQTARDLKAIGYSGQERSDGSPVINVGVERKDGMGVGAGNLGMPGYQVALGFSEGFPEGSNPSEAHRFAQRVISKMKERWHVEFVPDPAKSGALPMKSCN